MTADNTRTGPTSTHSGLSKEKTTTVARHVYIDMWMSSDIRYQRSFTCCYSASRRFATDPQQVSAHGPRLP